MSQTHLFAILARKEMQGIRWCQAMLIVGMVLAVVALGYLGDTIVLILVLALWLYSYFIAEYATQPLRLARRVLYDLDRLPGAISTFLYVVIGLLMPLRALRGVFHDKPWKEA